MPKYKINVEKRITKDKLIVDAKRIGEKDPAAHMSDLYAMESRIQVAHTRDLNALENRINIRIDASNADLKQFILANK